MKHYSVVIIGAGTAGLTARREVAKKTDDYIVVDDGPLGTTCARVGCMPSKVLIQVANDFYRQNKFSQQGIRGTLEIDRTQVMEHVRSLRDRFVRGVRSGMEDWSDKLVRKRATFVDANTLDLEGEKVTADKIIIATGSTPVIPGPWRDFSDFILDTNDFFEMKELPKSVAVFGLGVIGIELGQALHRLGSDVIGITKGKGIGGLTDPVLQEYVAEKFSQEMNINFGGGEILGVSDDGLVEVKAGGKSYFVEKILVSVGRSPNLKNLNFENTGVSVNDRGVPKLEFNTMKLSEAPHLFLPGDVNADRPILHEAADEGKIAGYNAVNEEQCFKRRTGLGITFSDPNIATVGKRHADLVRENTPFVTGAVSFEGQGRSIVKLKEQGLLHVYVHENTNELLGAEIHAPSGEHIAHLLSWAMAMKLTVFESLRMPFYHPVIEEGLRTALRDAAKKLESFSQHSEELFRCDDPPVR